MAAIDQFVDEKVDAIVLQVVGDPNALLGPLQRAQKAGIKVFSLGPTPGFPCTLIQFDDGADGLGRKSGEYMCKATGGTGEIAMIEAIEIPVLLPRWNVFLETIKANCPNLKVVAIERAIPDDAATARPIAEDLLTRFPQSEGDLGDGRRACAGFGGLAAKAAGRDIIVTGLNGEVVGLDGVKQGVIVARWDMMPTDIGAQLGEKAAEFFKAKRRYPPRPKCSTRAQVMWDSKTVANWKPYDKRVKYPGLQ